jgi:predicted PurR-regulated permease PerM
MRRRSISLLVFVAVLVLTLWLLPSVLLLIFAGVLLAVFLRGGGDLLFRRFGLSGMARSLLFALLVLLAVAGFSLLAAAPLAEQANQLWQQVPRMAQLITNRLEAYSWGQELLEQLQPENLELPSGGGRTAVNALGSTFGILGNAVLLIFLGIYFAVDPGLHRRGIEQLLAPSLRPKAHRMCQEAGETLRGWLGAQLISMTVVGVLTWLGLWALGVPLAVLLGVIAAVLTFIPTIGPVISAVPAVLLGLESGLTGALSVIALFVVIQSIESYLVTPYVQQRSVDLPPSLTIISMVAMGTLFGVMGLAMATPLAALALMLTRRLYVEDYLDQEPQAEGPVILPR